MHHHHGERSNSYFRASLDGAPVPTFTGLTFVKEDSCSDWVEEEDDPEDDDGVADVDHDVDHSHVCPLLSIADTIDCP